MTPPPQLPDHELASDAEGFADFVDLLEPAAPPADGLDRLLEAALPGGRLGRFAESVAELLDIAVGEAAVLLDRAGSTESYEAGPFPGVALYHVSGGPNVRGAITGFVRIVEDAGFPEHHHLGAESVLVLQGSLLEPETGRVYRPGEIARADAGSAHTTVARPGPDLVYLAVLFAGLRVGDTEMRADDPRL